MSNYPEKFRIPADRIPKAWSQGLYKCCGMASVVKVLEVINSVKKGEYKMLSKGYAYGRHSNPVYKSFKSDVGIDYDYTMKSILERGTVYEEDYPGMNELPDIMDDVSNLPNIEGLDAVAENTRAKAVIKIPGDAYFKENVKKYLYEKQMPLVGNMTGKLHCTVIVGWDENGFEFCEHDGRVDEKTGRSWVYGGGKFNFAYYIDGGIEDIEMPKEYKRFDSVEEFKMYLNGLNVTRKINRIQLHHTSVPSYRDFKDNHVNLQNAMRDYHMIECDMVDIAQQFTIFPDGVILTGRDINTAPAGIKGANSGGICIECVGNFDIGGDTMTEKQKNTIVGVVKTLLDKFNLNAADNVTYHAWWSSDGREIGDYSKTYSAKTCPGTNFFGGNTLSEYRKTLMPLIEKYGKVEIMLESGNDIVWELMNGAHKIEITEVERAIKALDQAKVNPDFASLYWIIYKIVNKGRG